MKDRVKRDHPEKQRALAERTFDFAVNVLKRSPGSIQYK